MPDALRDLDDHVRIVEPNDTPRRQAKSHHRPEPEFLPVCDHPACAQLAAPYNVSNVCLLEELRKETDGINSTALTMFNVIAGTGTGTTKIGCFEPDCRLA